MILNKIERRFIKEIHHKKPIIHFITNYVTVSDVCNTALAVGGSSVVADEPYEVEEITSIANALVINIGTINKTTFNAMIIAGKKANELNIPVILDPCGVNATQFRKKAINTILSNIKISVIKGNYGEIETIYSIIYENKTQQNSRGVDNCSKSSYIEVSNTIKSVAKIYNCVCCATGKIDIITDGKNLQYCNYGNSIMAKTTGTGCMLNGIIACGCSTWNNFYQATYLSCSIFEKKYKKFLSYNLKRANIFNKY